MRRLPKSIREPQGDAVGASSTGPRLGRILLVCTLAGLFLAWIGPFGSAQGSPVSRLLYWVGVVNLGGLLGWTVILLVRMIPALKPRPWGQVLATALLMTPPGAVLVWAWTRLLFPPFASLGGPLGYVTPVLVISLVMSAINMLATPRTLTPATEAAPLAEPQPPRFLARLPDRLKGSELYAVQAEDHYLRVHTSKGSDLILCRLADAVAELEGIEGLQTHRSWWVARSAVISTARSDGRAVLTLTSGVEAPVSRSALPTLRDRGWL